MADEIIFYCKYCGFGITKDDFTCPMCCRGTGLKWEATSKHRVFDDIWDDIDYKPKDWNEDRWDDLTEEELFLKDDEDE